MVEQKSLSRRAWGELLILAMIWGGSFLSIRVALNELSVVSVVAHRVLWAAVILWGVVLVRRLPLPRDPRIWGAFLVMGLLNNVIPFGLMAWGQLHISTGLTSILNASTAVFGVVVAAAVFADERLTARRAIGVTLGFAGVATAIGLDALAQFDIRSLAQLAVLGGTFSYALASAWGRRNFGGLHPLVAAAGMLGASALVMVPAAFVIDGPMTLRLAPATLLAVAYYSVVATALAYVVYFRVQAMAGAGNLMLCTLMVAPIAIVLGAVFLGETLRPSAYVGFALLASGLVILNRKPRHRALRPQSP
ncbi:DMT family transporter [Oceaniglobus indicus]|uniref:DMT family transporter n=1 Tax=Oceaniglobus indicus TaxID=2047749 RepID=UPI000C18A820|nr:DMT family transporter [Oceaniglobus indicus]